MNPLDTLRRVLMGALDVVNELGMQRARIERLAAEAGVSLEIPEKPGKPVTEAIRDDILQERARYGEAEWLSFCGPRDQICVRFGISRLQIAGVLAAATKAGNGGGNGDKTVAPASPTPGASGPSMITADPKTWPSRPGPRPVPPTIDDIDRQIAEAVIKAGRWEELRHKIVEVRLLTSQQVAGLRAVYTRTHPVPDGGRSSVR